MITSAMRIARLHPALKKFTIRYSHDSWLSHDGVRPKQVGTYEVVRPLPGHGLDPGAGGGEDYGCPRLVASEWGIGVFGKRFARHSVHDLRVRDPRASLDEEQGRSPSRSLSWSLERWPKFSVG